MSKNDPAPGFAAPSLPSDFDPDAAASGSGIYGLPFTANESYVVVIPVPFEATTSYGGGTARAPQAVLQASRQVDLFDHETGKPYAAGIAMLDVPEEIILLNRNGRAAALPIIESGGAIHSESERRELDSVNAASESVNRWVHETSRSLLERGKMPVVLGGDHSVPFGQIEAYAERYPGVGILHLDAHADLRESYEGFTWSHASIFHNVMTRIEGVGKLVQVGLRDVGSAENAMIESSNGRIVAYFDADLSANRDEGVPFGEIANAIAEALPENVYLSWDIDGLEPTLCPNTGTPVPGGLSWNEAIALLRAVVRSGRRIVGLDLCEVTPGETEWDANVGARLLYKMIGFALMSQR
ncbi:MAG: agmatinase family protein [Thermoanaerobaculia bacterium]